ncbi:hypothetical protein J2T56_003269 [Natronobacillus azotifigens]|uniref:Uncharacterized protein n=1 Tax=Natronobacillus azotifigens TaxID=472978 RepID=A0A9J6RGT2_9BACI|nr:hypothetical protein [Natronobacillus azotifigens]MCZ0704662.1 hypothetical protein [Natronobacillus azotifigens]
MNGLLRIFKRKRKKQKNSFIDPAQHVADQNRARYHHDNQQQRIRQVL